MVHQKMKQVRHIPNKSIANLSMSITFVTYSVMGMKRYETIGYCYNRNQYDNNIDSNSYLLYNKRCQDKINSVK